MDTGSSHSHRVILKSAIALGVVLCASGTAAIAAHVGAQAVPGGICGSVSPANLIFPHLQNGAHCWGCPAVLAGVSALLSALLMANGGNEASGPDVLSGTAHAIRSAQALARSGS